MPDQSPADALPENMPLPPVLEKVITRLPESQRAEGRQRLVAHAIAECGHLRKVARPFSHPWDEEVPDFVWGKYRPYADLELSPLELFARPLADAPPKRREALVRERVEELKASIKEGGPLPQPRKPFVHREPANPEARPGKGDDGFEVTRPIRLDERLAASAAAGGRDWMRESQAGGFFERGVDIVAFEYNARREGWLADFLHGVADTTKQGGGDPEAALELLSRLQSVLEEKEDGVFTRSELIQCAGLGIVAGYMLKTGEVGPLREMARMGRTTGPNAGREGGANPGQVDRYVEAMERSQREHPERNMEAHYRHVARECEATEEAVKKGLLRRAKAQRAAAPRGNATARGGTNQASGGQA
jgi:hypothetical protein